MHAVSSAMATRRSRKGKRNLDKPLTRRRVVIDKGKGQRFAWLGLAAEYQPHMPAVNFRIDPDAAHQANQFSAILAAAPLRCAHLYVAKEGALSGSHQIEGRDAGRADGRFVIDREIFGRDPCLFHGRSDICGANAKDHGKRDADDRRDAE